MEEMATSSGKESSTILEEYMPGIDVKQLSEEFQTQLIQVVTNLKSEITQKAVIEEKNQVELEDLSLQIKGYEQRLQTLTCTESTLLQEAASLRNTSNSALAEKNALEAEVQALKSDNASLSQIVEKYEGQISQANVSQDDVKGQLKSCQTELSEVKLNLVSKQQQHELISFQLKQKETEVTKLLEERSSLDADKASLMRQISRLQMEKSTDLSSFNRSLEGVKSELTNSEKMLQMYKEQCDETVVKLREEQAKSRECREQFISSEEFHRQELNAQKKLVAMYKEGEERAATELKECVKATQEYKDCLEQMSAEHSAQAANSKATQDEMESTIKDKDNLIAELQSELSRINEMMQQNSESPDATAELARLIKSGLTYSQLYHQFHQTAQELTLQKAENERINDNFDELVEDFKSIKPRYDQLKTAHDASSSMVESLSEQLRLNIKNLDSEARHNADLKRSLTRAQNESSRHRLENQDLATQVQVLTKELHKALGGRVTLETTSASQPDLDSLSANEIITNQLVSFKSIQELQRQNQSLRSALRNMAEEQEADDSSGLSVGKSRQQAERDVETLKLELNQLKQNRVKQEELVQAIIKQRDMYKQLVEQGAHDLHKEKSSSPVRQGSISSEVDVEKMKSFSKEISTLKHSLLKAEDDFSKYKQEAQANERSMQDELIKMRKELTEAKMNNTRLSTQLDYSVESSKVSEKNCASYKQEVASLRNKSEQLSSLVAKNEEMVSSLKAHLSEARDSGTRSTIQVSQLRQELEINQASLRRLEADYASSKRDNSFQLQLLSNVQNIQKSIETNNVTMQAHYKTRLEQASSDKEMLSSHISTLKKEIEAGNTKYRSDLEQLTGKLEQAQSERDELQTRVNQLLQELQTAKASRASLGSNADMMEEGGEPSESPELKHAKSEIEALKDQLRLAGAASDEYRQVADRLEQTLREQTTANNQYQAGMEAKCTKLQQDLDKVSSLYEDLTKERNSLFEERANLEQKLSIQKSELTTNIAQLESELSLKAQALESKQELGQRAVADLKQSAELNNELTAKYEASLAVESSLTEQINSLKAELQELASKLTDAESEGMATEARLQANHASSEAREKQFAAEKKSLEEQLASQKSQTKLLHQQLDHMSSKQASQALESLSSGDEPDINSMTTQLLQLTQTLRQEKELFETKLQSSEAECRQLQVKVQFLEGELKSAKENLEISQSESEMDVLSRTQHAQLLQKVEQMNLLTDSNRILRQDRDALQPTIDLLKKQVQELEQEKAASTARVSELQLQVTSLTGEKTSLEASVEHWRGRHNTFVDQTQKEKSVTLAKHTQEVGDLNKSNSQISAQLDKLKQDLTKTTSGKDSEISQLQNRVGELDGSIKELEEKLQTVRDELVMAKSNVAKEKDIGEKLKRIGQKYRRLYTEMQEKIEKGETGEGAKLDSPKPGTSATQKPAEEKPAVSQPDTTALSKELSDNKEELTRLRIELNMIKKQQTQTSENLDAATEECKTLTEELKKVTEEKEKMSDLTGKHKEMNNKLRQRIIELKEQVAKYENEMAQYKQNLAKSVSETDKLKQDVAEGRAKIQSLEEIQAVASQHSSQLPSPGSHANISGAEPRIGNVKPMAATGSQVRRIEVRPMTQQPQMVAVLPTPSNVPDQSTSHELQSTTAPSIQTSAASSASEEPLVMIVPPNTVSAGSHMMPSSSAFQSATSSQATVQPSTSFGSSAPSASVSVAPSTASITPSAAAVQPTGSWVFGQFATPSTEAISSTSADTVTRQPQEAVTGQPREAVAVAPQEIQVVEPQLQEPADDVLASVVVESVSIPETEVQPSTSQEAQSNVEEMTESVTESDTMNIDIESAGPSAAQGGSKRTREELDEGSDSDDWSSKRAREAEAEPMPEYSLSPEQGPQASDPVDESDLSQDDIYERDETELASPTAGSHDDEVDMSDPEEEEPAASSIVVVVSSDEDQEREEEEEEMGSYAGSGAVSGSDEEGSQSGAEEEIEGEYSELPEVGVAGEEADLYQFNYEIGASEADEYADEEEDEGSSEGDMEAEAEPEMDEEDVADSDSDIVEIIDERPRSATSMTVSSSQSLAQPQVPTTSRSPPQDIQLSGMEQDDGVVPASPTLQAAAQRYPDIEGFATLTNVQPSSLESPAPRSEPFSFMRPISSELANQASAIGDTTLTQFADMTRGEDATVESSQADISDSAPSLTQPSSGSPLGETIEEVSSSEASSSSIPRRIEPIVWSEPSVSSQSDQPTSSTGRQQRARRGRGTKLQRPSFNRPNQN